MRARFYAKSDLGFAEVYIEDGEFKEVTVESLTGGYCIERSYHSAKKHYDYAIDFINTYHPEDVKVMADILNEGSAKDYCKELIAE